MRKIKIGIVGCGAITEKMYIPVLTALHEVEVAALVDKNLARAHTFAKEFTDAYITNTYQEIFDKVEAVIIALPHFLHAQGAVEFLRRGIPVLVEKPMGVTSQECKRMIEEADNAHSILAVGLIRRFYEVSKLIKYIISDGWLGKILSFDVREGAIYKWQAASDAFLKKENGGGVLLDTGSHVLDMLIWWLGDYASVTYHDDSAGGIEANCLLNLVLKNGARGTVELSKTRNLRNTYQIRGEKASLEVGVKFNSEPMFFITDLPNACIKFTLQKNGEGEFLDVARKQLEDFISAIKENRKPFIPGEEGQRAIALINECYQNRLALEQPWLAVKT